MSLGLVALDVPDGPATQAGSFLVGGKPTEWHGLETSPGQVRGPRGQALQETASVARRSLNLDISSAYVAPHRFVGVKARQQPGGRGQSYARSPLLRSPRWKGMRQTGFSFDRGGRLGGEIECALPLGCHVIGALLRLQNDESQIGVEIVKALSRRRSPPMQTRAKLTAPDVWCMIVKTPTLS